MLLLNGTVPTLLILAHSRACRKAVSDSCSRHFYLVIDTKAQCESPL